MGECGCVGIEYKAKIIDKDGAAWCFGVYSSCSYCESPAGVQILRVPPGSDMWGLWEINRIPDLEVHEQSGMAFISVLAPEAARQQMEKMMVGYKPENGVIDAIDAETLAEEAFSDFRGICDGEFMPKPAPVSELPMVKIEHPVPVECQYCGGSSKVMWWVEHDITTLQCELCLDDE